MLKDTDMMTVGTYKGRMKLGEVPAKHLLYLFNNQSRRDVVKLPVSVKKYILRNLDKLMSGDR